MNKKFMISFEKNNDLKVLNINKGIDKQKLLTSLCIPSYAESYSMFLGFIQKWFIDQFPKEYFKYIYINDKHMLDEYRKRDFKEMPKIPKPSLAISTNPDWSFTNDTLNWPFGSTNMFTRITNYRDLFFKDTDHNIYMGMQPELSLIKVNFRIRVDTRAKQVDLFKYMENVLGTSSTTGMYLDMDYHIPKELIIQIAKDGHFTINNGDIVDKIKFIQYLNSNSKVPFLYKLRGMTGTGGYFVRTVNYVHIRYPDSIELDDGERQGFVSSNYVVNYNIEVRMPVPRYYRYMSIYQHSNIKILDDSGSIKAYCVNLNRIPAKNIKGWDQYLTTDYLEEDKSKELSIDLKELFDGSDIYEIIKYTIKQGLSPELFIDIHLFNLDREIPSRVDWEECKLYSLGLVLGDISHIVAYVDKQYLNDQIINYKDYYNNRAVIKE